MLVNVLKFIHLLLTLSLLGSSLFCLILISFRKSAPAHPPQNDMINRVNRTMLWLLAFSLITGTLLVYPKHFTFHTPWIQAAYLLVFLVGLLVSGLIFLRKKNQWAWVSRGIYLILIVLLIGVIHDAVSKTTFLF